MSLSPLTKQSLVYSVASKPAADEIESLLSGLTIAGETFYVNPSTSVVTNGSLPSDTNNTGLSQFEPFQTLQKAINSATSGRGDVIVLAPGAYDETVTVDKDGVTIIGAGGRGAAGIAVSAAGAEGMLVSGDDVTLINVGVAANTTGDYACRVTGSRFRAYGCKFEGCDTSGYAFGVGPGTAAQITAGTQGKGADALLVDCEFAWSFDGVMIFSSDYGASTQNRFENCRFHNQAGTSFNENDVGAIGAGRNIEVVNCTFGRAEDNTKPSDFVNADSVGYTGYFTGNAFALATNASADLKIAAGVMWMANKTEAGNSTARPA